MSTGHTLAKANQVTRRAHKVRSPLPADRMDELIFLVASDGGSLGGMPREGSQLGVSVILAGPEVLEQETDVCVLEALSQRMRRQVRSSMGVEVGAVNMAMEHGDFARAILSEIHDPAFDVRSWRSCIARWRQIGVIDAKTVFDSLSGDGVSEDSRTAVAITAVKADLEGEYNMSLRWIPGDQHGQRQSHEVVRDWPLWQYCLPLVVGVSRRIQPSGRSANNCGKPQERPEGPASSREERCTSDKHECRSIACSPSR